jgi:poly-gamma-glutamate system protein
MPDFYRPRAGRWTAISPRILAVVGWALALAGAAAGPANLMPSIAVRSSVARGSDALGSRAARARAAMQRAERFLAAERQRLGVVPDAEAASDASGLLGVEVTPLVTTLGSLEAKRIATNAEWARVLTLKLAGAGVGKGDLVAASFSGSFPGLNLALASACQALGARVVAISSVTASTWGANQAGFTWPEIEGRLLTAGLLERASIAVTAGGEDDDANDLDPDGRTLARRIRDETAAALGVPALRPVDFRDAVERRLRAYREAAAGRRLALYANVGGADASLGRSAAILRLRTGFLPAVPVGAPRDQGVTARLAGEGVPILMLLNVRDLAIRWGIPLAPSTQ